MADARRSHPRAAWLVRPDRHDARPEHLRPWLPQALTAHPEFSGPDAAEAVRRLCYIVVDELVDDAVGLTVSAWPYADDNGRLRFPQGVLANVGCTRAAVQAQLYGAGVRSIRVGDVFGARLAPPVAERLAAAGHSVDVQVSRPDELLEGPVYDLTTAARTVGKLAYYGAMSTVITEWQARRDNLMALARRGEPPSRVRHLPPRPTDGPPS